MSIVLEHLTKRYEGHAVVWDVSLQIATGELFVLLGPSGSGKSTILRMLAGLADPDGGRILLHDRDVTPIPPQKRGVGFVFQHYALFRHMTVAENVEFALRVRGVGRAARRARREELLELVGLAGLGGRRPDQLSGGQQQRVALARALAHSPEVLLLDEPFGALDARIRTELRRTVRAIQQSLRVTAVFVTHDQEEAFEIADRIAVLDHGRLLEVGSPSDLYLHPRTEFAATFLGTANLVVGERDGSSVRIGGVAVPLARSPVHEGGSARVQVLVRPEDVEVRESEDALRWPILGRGVVEGRDFLGAFERLAIRLPEMTGVRALAPAPRFGGDSLVVAAVRSQHQARRFPLGPGDEAWVGLRRVHTLAHPGLSILVVDDRDRRGAAVRAARELARRSRARLAVLRCGIAGDAGRGAPEDAASAGDLGADVEIHRSAEDLDGALASLVDHCSFDLVVAFARGAEAVEVAEAVLRSGDHHVLIVPDEAPAFRRLLVTTASGEPGKRGVAFAGRVARHLDAEATILTVLPAGDAAREQAERHLAASERTLQALGVRTAARIRSGPPEREILAELQEGEHDAAVVGTPLAPPGRPVRLEGPVAALVRATPRPLLLVRSQGGAS
jgi:sulfate transport system ATP-binding protein